MTILFFLINTDITFYDILRTPLLPCYWLLPGFISDTVSAVARQYGKENDHYVSLAYWHNMPKPSVSSSVERNHVTCTQMFAD